MVPGKRYYGGGAVDSDVEVARHFMKTMKEAAERGGATNAVNFVSLLRWPDRWKFKKTMKELAGKMDGFVHEQRKGK
ncbi:unnamed protein product [Linum trigynum]|uniref:Uncharacterized protein n=1 Tax=Linum trigynum TaxID=586398 RepID=A0AAV2EUW9_9ROSI